MTIGEKYTVISFVLIQFQVPTAFKSTNTLFGLLKNVLKTSNIFPFKCEFYNSYQHLYKIDGDSISIIQPQQGRGSADSIQITFVNGQFNIISGVENRQHVARTFSFTSF